MEKYLYYDLLNSPFPEKIIYGFYDESENWEAALFSLSI